MASKNRLEYELSFNNREDVLKLPVNPQSDPETDTPGNNTNWQTTDVGTFKAIGHQGLKNIKIASFFPNHKYSFCTYSDFPPPKQCVEMIEKWQKSKRPIRLIITGYLNEAFAIEDFRHSVEKGTGDINFELSLEEYRFANEETTVSTEIDEESLITVINLVEGQTLCEIADEWLGNSDRYKDIAEWNDIVDVGHPWSETEKNFHQLQLVCEKGTPGYDRLFEEMKKGNGYG